ncbi:MAG: DNA methylase [Oscillospiraceae bacterium]
MENKVFVAIDLKSFYASVACMERGLDPLTTNLVVADAGRSEKTICLAVSPTLRAYGVPGRARLFEVVQKVREINAARLQKAPGHAFTGSSSDDAELKASPELSLDYVVALPQMAHYMECSTRIYNIYLKYIAPEDIHVYSVDEVFMDITNYLQTCNLTPRELVMKMILDVLETTGITATAGIGTNLYLAKVAMDIEAKRTQADKNGVRIAELDEMSYRRSLWAHRPLIDFWRVGRGYAKKLEEHGLFTMGDVARCSIGKTSDYYNEALLYKLFGVNAQLLIDHAWGWEPCTITDIKAYKPESSSLGAGQVLMHPYSFDKAKLIVLEMTDLLALDLVDKGLVADQLVLTVGYDIESLTDPERKKKYHGTVTTDQYGRSIPKHAHGTANLGKHTSSTKLILDAMSELFERIVDPNLLSRRVTVAANHVVEESSVPAAAEPEQLDLFTDYGAKQMKDTADAAEREREKKRQRAILAIKKKHGKNAILKGMNLEEDGTTIDRNSQIGGHKA